MKKNLGSADRLMRILVAIVFASLYFTGTVTGIWGMILLIAGIVFLLTSFVSFCPIYWTFGWSSRKNSVSK